MRSLTVSTCGSYVLHCKTMGPWLSWQAIKNQSVQRSPTCGLHLTMLKEPEPRSATSLQRWLNSCTLAGMWPATTQKQVPRLFQATSCTFPSCSKAHAGSCDAHWLFPTQAGTCASSCVLAMDATSTTQPLPCHAAVCPAGPVQEPLNSCPQYRTNIAPRQAVYSSLRLQYAAHQSSSFKGQKQVFCKVVSHPQHFTRPNSANATSTLCHARPASDLPA